MDFDRWAGIRIQTDADVATRRRGLVVITLLYMGCTLVLSGHGWVTEGYAPTRLIGVGATALYVAVLVMTRRAASIVAPALLVVAINYLGDLAYVLIKGGATGPGTALFIGVPFLAAFLLGARAAAWCAGLVLATLWIVYALVPPAPGVTQGPIGPIIVSIIIVIATLYSLLFETVSRRLADQLRQSLSDAEAASRRAEASSEAKSRFLAMISHELRTPMNGVIGMADVLAGTDLDDEQRGHVRTISSSGCALLTVINDLLDFTKMEAGHLDVAAAPYEPGAVIDQACTLLRAEAQAKGIDLDCAVDPALPPELVGDDGKVRQVLLNLVANAVKFTAEGSVTVRARAAGDAVLFEVEDTGLGIAEDKQALIFDPFQQADADTTRTYGGTGLGLSISRQLAEAMDGTLGVASAPGLGSTFTLRLPRVVPAAPRMVTARTAPPPPPSAPGTRRVLVAEDNPVNRQVIGAMLTGTGWDAVFAEDGVEATEHHAAAGPGGFRAVLMDINMPRLDGYGAARAIRQKEGEGEGEREEEREAERWPRTPIVALTAHSGPDAKERSLAAGMDEHVAKPVRRAELVAVLGRAAGARRAQDAAGLRRRGT